MVVVIAACTSGLPLHDETAFAATVSVFEQVVMVRLPDEIPRLQHQCESTTPGTTPGMVESDQHDAQRHEDDQKDDQETAHTGKSSAARKSSLPPESSSLPSSTDATARNPATIPAL